MHPFNRDLTRWLAVYKLWTSGGFGLDFERFRPRIEDRRNYNLDDLRSLLRKDQNPDLQGMIRRSLILLCHKLLPGIGIAR
jgi:hypothetical protein